VDVLGIMEVFKPINDFSSMKRRILLSEWDVINGAAKEQTRSKGSPLGHSDANAAGGPMYAYSER
jgi:hypothetical protein